MNWKDKRALVTGGAGFIGMNLVRGLTASGCQVTVLDDFSAAPRANLSGLPVQTIEGSVNEEATFRKLPEIDYVFHLASPSSVILYRKEPQKCYHTTTISWINVLRYAKENGIRKVVYPSSGSVYGRASPPQKETTTPRPTNLYAVAKFSCEQMVEATENPPPVTMLRIFAGYGPGETHKGEIASPVGLFLKSMAANERPIIYGDGSQSRDFIYIDDVVRIMMRAAETSTTGIVNAGTGHTHTFNDVVKMLNKRLNKNIQPQYINKPMNYLEQTLADTSLMKNAFGVSPIS
ncbi:NAD-dependent epimerase/dehydratase family protein, partial [Candidatus Bathyarchaeota archaeon]|nr:NAD-dependent epimerase/dehydratase family protein [Candidatus Bathyarchaeota archaeon]